MKIKTREYLLFIWKVLLVILINIMIILMVYSSFTGLKAEAVTIGSQGNTVKEIQKALKYNGYYNGEIDGIFGENTEQL